METRKFMVVVKVEIRPNDTPNHGSKSDEWNVAASVESLLMTLRPGWKRHSIKATEVDEFGELDDRQEEVAGGRE